MADSIHLEKLFHIRQENSFHFLFLTTLNMAFRYFATVGKN